ncbi:hypothetical protein C8R32_101178 [Nitrosospira sp. Nsp5]|uniref:Uncharacterized protein n=1 Tax=Nitrosospira multiformis TaxID=1231 RepID=A0ABY0TL80_9PROT|nr:MULTISPECIES: hypothetical protein [Nitrosospira]PTR10648.1 hypothetical protein C8R32_101178 [Nitrosospira sp. Nsp5]SDQ78722.1 hypothetical protein SAMN05216402_2284 [Nitrosospira multiformis]
MESKPITNTESIINSGDLRTRISWLKQALNYRFSEEYSKELKALNAFETNIEPVASFSTYAPGADLIRDSDFEEYKKTMEEQDTTDISKAAFSPVDFNGVIYWLRQ